MKKLVFFLIIALSACNSHSNKHQKAENALDAGREFIGACLQGDFSKASFLMVQSESNKEKLSQLESYYRQKDKEGRQQYRTASINIHGITEINSNTTIIKYNNSFDKTPDSLIVVKQADSWLVDLSTDKKPG